MGADRQTSQTDGECDVVVVIIIIITCGVNTPFRPSRLSRSHSSTPIWIITCRFIRCSLKLECEKLATEKVEIQRHYVMVGTVDVIA